MLTDLALWVADVMDKAGYFGLGGLVALESVFPPVPSEVVLPMGGFLTGQGRLNFPLAVLAATLGSVVGALILYELGRRLGHERMTRFVRRRGKWLMVCVEDYEKADSWFRRHGKKAVLIGRFAPGVRSFVSIPAGIQKMPLTQFTLLTAVGSGIYNTVLIGFGWLLGHNWETVSEYTGVIETALWVALGAAILYWILYKRRKNTPCAA